MEFSYRQNRIGPAFLPGGGTQDDGGIRALLVVKPALTVGLSAQYERYRIPLLGGQRRDFLASFETTYTPHWRPLHN